MISAKFKKNLKDLITACIKDIAREGMAELSLPPGVVIPEIELEAPRDKSHGDLSTNVALRLAKYAGKSPIDYASILSKKINESLKISVLADSIEKTEAKSPGFINLWFSEKYLLSVLKYISLSGVKYGSVDFGRGVKINIEFVSANPTGPLTIAHARQAAFGDSLANILLFAGYRVTREYYLNDEGNQMNMLAKSIRARYLGLFGMDVEFPADGYRGAYINDIAMAIKDKYGARFAKPLTLPASKGCGCAVSGASSDERIETVYSVFFRDFGCRYIMDDIRDDLKKFNVKFDVWYSQKKLCRSGKIRAMINFLSKKGLIYKKDGAVWFRSTELGDDKDRVIIKSTGEYTYLTPDIAYHMDKFKRGFKRVIDIWGPDHHGYIPRMKAAVMAMGFEGDSFNPLIVQLSTLYRDGKILEMSTRSGEFITLRELRDEVGKDAARFFFLRRKRDSHLDFDMELAKKHSMDNPVYYIQYAYARICSLLEYKKVKIASDKNSQSKEYLRGRDELDIIKALGYFPIIVETCAKLLEVFPLLAYLEEIASLFHSYYNKYRVVTDDESETEARLLLCLAVRTVLANGLRLLGVENPKSM